MRSSEQLATRLGQRRQARGLTRSCPIGQREGTARCLCMDDLTKELWQGVTQRVDRPEPVYQPPLLVAEPPLPVADETGWPEFLASPKTGAIFALACVLGLLAIVS